MFFNAFQGTRDVGRNLIAKARILRASRWRVTHGTVVAHADITMWITPKKAA
jgi:ABC-type nitrate/sulfonate/bicarbonate transport system permease component